MDTQKKSYYNSLLPFNFQTVFTKETMADQYAKDGSSKDQGVSSSLNPSSPDLASMFQEPHWNENTALRWADILSEEPPHPSHDCNVQSSSSVFPGISFGYLVAI